MHLIIPFPPSNLVAGAITQSLFSPIQGYIVTYRVKSMSMHGVTFSLLVEWAPKQEEILDPNYVVEMTSHSYRGHEGVGAVKDLKNLRWDEQAGVSVHETTGDEWRKSKGAKCVQSASTTGQPWIDEAHRRYWVAKHEGHIVGLLILTPVPGPDTTRVTQSTPTLAPTQTYKPRFSFKFGSKRSASTSSDSAEAESSSDESSPSASSPTFSPQHSASSSSSSLHTTLEGCTLPHPPTSYYLIKNAISFPSAPRGTSDPHLSHPTPQRFLRPSEAPTVTFGITASDVMKPIDNLSGWKISSLSKVYGQVAKGAGLWKRGDFRAKFDSGRDVIPKMGLSWTQSGFRGR